MPQAYTEDQLVEQPAIGLFAELGWATVSAWEETFGAPSRGLRPRSRPTGEGASPGVWPLHQLVFAGMLRGIVKSAEERQ